MIRQKEGRVMSKGNRGEAEAIGALKHMESERRAARKNARLFLLAMECLVQANDMSPMHFMGKGLHDIS
jgi:hypothetical protein